MSGNVHGEGFSEETVFPLTVGSRVSTHRFYGALLSMVSTKTAKLAEVSHAISLSMNVRIITYNP